MVGGFVAWLSSPLRYQKLRYIPQPLKSRMLLLLGGVIAMQAAQAGPSSFRVETNIDNSAW